MDKGLTARIEAELAKPAGSVASAAPTPDDAAPPTPGEVAVKAVRFDGVEKAIADAKGKVVLVDCWATWCGPCVASFPKLVEKHQQYGSQGLAVMSLSLDRPADAGKVLPFLQNHNATFTNLHLTMDQAAQKGLQEKFAYKNAIPHAVLFDKTGKRVWSGHPMDPKLTPMIEAELAK
jgi:thiol-disulfide isomerase/thioredoxin